MRKEIIIPENMDVCVEKNFVRVSYKGNSLERKFSHPRLKIFLEGGTLIIETDSPDRNDQSVVGTVYAHINNMIAGLKKGFIYKLKCVYAHFPMSVSVQGDQFVIQNFMGEKYPRKIRIINGVTVKVNGENIEILGADKEKVGRMSALIEQRCYKGGKDARKFQDGIYIVEKTYGEEK